jgi:polysaccharide pyruvyl transferase WcaK-like protein
MKKIGLLDHMGLGNLGDAATQDAVIHHLRLRHPDAQICLFSLDPEDSARRHGLQSFPIESAFELRQEAKLAYAAADASTVEAASTDGPEEPAFGLLRRLKRRLQRIAALDTVFVALWRIRKELGFMARSYRRIKDFDLLVISAGGQIDDSWGGPWAAPLNLLRWSALARATNTKLIFLSVGAGPLRARTSRVLAATALRLASFRSFRDEESRLFVEALGVRKSNAVVPDPAHSLPVDVDAYRDTITRERMTVGIGPIPYMDPRWWPDKDHTAYRDYVAKLSKFAAWLVENGHTVRFILGEVYMDKTVVDDVRQTLDQLGPRGLEDLVIEEPIATVDELMEELCRTDVVLSSRFHGVLLAQLVNKPVVAVSYHQKIDSLMIDMGQPDHVVPIDDFKVEDLIRIFQDVVAILPAIKATLSRRTAAHRDALDRLYDGVFGERPS